MLVSTPTMPPVELLFTFSNRMPRSKDSFGRRDPVILQEERVVVGVQLGAARRNPVLHLRVAGHERRDDAAVGVEPGAAAGASTKSETNT